MIKDKFWQWKQFSWEKKEKLEKKNKFQPNLRLGACLAMCLKYGQIEPGFFYKHVLIEENECKWDDLNGLPSGTPVCPLKQNAYLLLF